MVQTINVLVSRAGGTVPLTIEQEIRARQIAQQGILKGGTFNLFGEPREVVQRVQFLSVESQRQRLVLEQSAITGRNTAIQNIISRAGERGEAVIIGDRIVGVGGQGFSVAPEFQQDFIQQQVRAPRADQVSIFQDVQRPQTLESRQERALTTSQVRTTAGGVFQELERRQITVDGAPNIGGAIRGTGRFIGDLGTSTKESFFAKADQFNLPRFEGERGFGLSFGIRGNIAQALDTPIADPGVLAQELFFVPAFSTQFFGEALSKRVVFRQAVPETTETFKTVVKPTPKGGIIRTEAVAETPARFQTVASPVEELFGEFTTEQIAKRTTVKTVSRGFVEGDQITAGIARRTAGRTSTDVFRFQGRSQEIGLNEVLTTAEQKSLSKITQQKRGETFISVPDDVKFFRTTFEAQKQFRLSGVVDKRLSLTVPPQGKTIQRGAGVSFVKPLGKTEFGELSGISAARVDITKSTIGGQAKKSSGIITTLEPKGFQGSSGTQFVKFDKQKTVSLANQLQDVSRSLSAQVKPTTSGLPKQPSLTTKIRPAASTQIKTTTKQLVTQTQPVKQNIISQQIFLDTTTIKPRQTNLIGQTPQIKTVSISRLQQSSGAATNQILSPVTIETPTPKQPTTTITKSGEAGPLDFGLPPPGKPPRTPITTFTPRTPSFFIIPGLGFKDTSPRRRTKKRKFKRRPSLIAVELGITAPKEAIGEISGLVARPIIRKRRKKR